MTKTLSETIKALRFPLMCLVIFIHADVSGIQMSGVAFNEADYPLFEVVHQTLSRMIAATAVPLFFVISGFLYFNNVEKISLALWSKKTKSRVVSLLVPYLFWNMITLLFYFIVQLLLPDMVSGKNVPISEYGVKDQQKCHIRDLG